MGANGLKNMSPSERQLYEYIKRVEEIMVSNIPSRMMGALPHLIRKGLVEVYKKQTVPWSPKKKKFVRVLVR